MCGLNVNAICLNFTIYSRLDAALDTPLFKFEFVIWNCDSKFINGTTLHLLGWRKYACFEMANCMSYWCDYNSILFDVAHHNDIVREVRKSVSRDIKMNYSLPGGPDCRLSLLFGCGAPPFFDTCKATIPSMIQSTWVISAWIADDDHLDFSTFFARTKFLQAVNLNSKRKSRRRTTRA